MRICKNDLEYVCSLADFLFLLSETYLRATYTPFIFVKEMTLGH